MTASDYITLAGGLLILGLLLAAAGIVFALRRGVRSLDDETRPLHVGRFRVVDEQNGPGYRLEPVEPRRMGDGLPPGQHRA